MDGQSVEHTVELPVIWDAMTTMWYHYLFTSTGCFFHRSSKAVWMIGRQIFPDNKFMGPIWDPPGSCQPKMGPMLAPWTLLSGLFLWHQSHNRVWWLLMAWHPYGTKAPGYYLIQYQPRAMSPDGITWPQCVQVQKCPWPKRGKLLIELKVYIKCSEIR